MIDLKAVRKISMLSDSVLERLQVEAGRGSGGILEIGPYIGGSTVALASGHMGRRKHAVIEGGGSNLDQPHLPTDDIIRDWRANVERFGVTDHVQLFPGWSNVHSVLSGALAHAGPIGLFFFDANGAIAEQMSLISRHLRRDCTLVLDDYIVSSGSKVKELEVRGWVDRMVANGALIETEVVDGAWIGRLGTDSPDVFNIYRREVGQAWLSAAPDPRVTPVAVYEDGVPLGPRNAMHTQVRDVGRGAYSHWSTDAGPYLLFSTSDNSDPSTNGRKYEFRPLVGEGATVAGERVAPVSQFVS